jgi:enolase 1/2/3
MGDAVSDTRIANVRAWQAFDSRGRPTVGCRVELASGAHGSVVVPSGASTGTHEVHELRDRAAQFNGMGVLAAVANAEGELARAVSGLDARDQHMVDAALRSADGTENLSVLGANAVLAISLGSAIASADHARRPLYETLVGAEDPLLPLPMVNIVSGGAHAGWSVDVQDVLVVPVGATSFEQAIEWSWGVRFAAEAIFTRSGWNAALVADEGGLSGNPSSNREMLHVVVDAIEQAGLVPGRDVAIAIDVAATQLLTDDGSYHLRAEGRTLTAGELVTEIDGWAQEFPLVSIEDPLGEDDWVTWSEATRRLAGRQIVGDDLFATNESRLATGVARGAANAILVKPNQNGTVSGAHDVLVAARSERYATVVSARSGDTEDAWLADLAVGWRAGQIKVGSLTRSERTGKWNRLLEIERCHAGCEFAGAAALGS